MKLLSQYGTTDQREIDNILEKRREEDEILNTLQTNAAIKVITHIQYHDRLFKFTLYVIEVTIA